VMKHLCGLLSMLSNRRRACSHSNIPTHHTWALHQQVVMDMGGRGPQMRFGSTTQDALIFVLVLTDYWFIILTFSIPGRGPEAPWARYERHATKEVLSQIFSNFMRVHERK
jgi:hypothetical protein